MMYEAEAVSREQIDGWRLAEAGLPTRVVNSAGAAGVKTVGELRGWSDSDLLRLRSLGRVSLEHIREFFRLCGRIERSALRFGSVAEVFELFLDTAQRSVLGARYGLYQRDLAPSRSWMTLQEIGNQEDKTRERIRQIEDAAKERLGSRLAAVCLGPFRRFFVEHHSERARVVSARELGALWGHEALGGLNPSAVLLLLSDLDPETVRYRNGYFSTLTEGEIGAIESAIERRLADSPAPVRLNELVTGCPPIASLPKPGDRQRAVAVIAGHLPEIASTTDERFFRYDTSVHPFLLEIIGGMDKPVHYRTVTALFNERVTPASRKGAGYILDTLNRNPGCVRVDRGLYRARP